MPIQSVYKKLRLNVPRETLRRKCDVHILPLSYSKVYLNIYRS